MSDKPVNATSVLNTEAQDILSAAMKDISPEVWKAIALVEQTESPIPAPVFIYTSLGTTGSDLI